VYSFAIVICFVVGCELQLHSITHTTYKDHFTESPFASSEFGRAQSFEGVHGTNRSEISDNRIKTTTVCYVCVNNLTHTVGMFF